MPFSWDHLRAQGFVDREFDSCSGGSSLFLPPLACIDPLFTWQLVSIRLSVGPSFPISMSSSASTSLDPLLFHAHPYLAHFNREIGLNERRDREALYQHIPVRLAFQTIQLFYKNKDPEICIMGPISTILSLHCLSWCFCVLNRKQIYRRKRNFQGKHQ